MPSPGEFTGKSGHEGAESGNVRKISIPSTTVHGEPLE